MIIAVDFDGVIAKYDGFKGKGKFGKPIDGAQAALTYFMMHDNTVIINTTRLEIDKVAEYLHEHNIPYDHINYCPLNEERFLHPAKICADVYIDDRNVQFAGDWDHGFIDKVLNFSPWWKKK